MAPMCEEAKSLPFKVRLRHYKTCQDQRCKARLQATKEIGRLIQKNLKRAAK